MRKAGFQPDVHGTETLGLPHRSDARQETPPPVPDYRLIKVIGRGAFGTVWLAEERLSHVFRAIKVLKTPYRKNATDPSKSAGHIDRELAGIHAFQTRAQEHPQLVRILKTGQCRMDDHDDHSAQTVYYVMEVADHATGPQPHHPSDYQPLTLDVMLRRNGRLKADSAISYFENLLDAVDHLHRAGMHHRDIKPTNVLFVNGVLKLADLGLTTTDNDESIGTPGYLPPDGTPDDLYALGKILYEMTTGLPAKDFPEWPADLDPATDPRLTPLRTLISDLAHPDKTSRIDDIPKIRRHLTAIQTGPKKICVSRRTAIASLTGSAATGALVGIGVTSLSSHVHDPTLIPLYDGSVTEDFYEIDGQRYLFVRYHSPGINQPLQAAGTEVSFMDLQSGLINGRVSVAGAFQIYNVKNPIIGDITSDRGEINQIYLIVGDVLILLYHGQPGEKPGTKGRFGVRGHRAIPLSVLKLVKTNSKIEVHLAFTAAPDPTHSRQIYRDRNLSAFQATRIATIACDRRI